MQKLIVCPAFDIETAINKYLSAGWTVVPGTLVLQGVEQVRPKLSNDPATPSLTVFKTHVAVVLQRADNGEMPNLLTSRDREYLEKWAKTEESSVALHGGNREATQRR